MRTIARVGLLAVVVAIALAAGGLASAEVVDDMGNESGTFDNSSNLTVSVDWNESIADPANATADATIYNATEYDDDPSTATEVATGTISAEEGNTTETEFTSADGLEDGTEYRVLVSADDTEADDVSIDFGGGFIGGLIGGGAAGGGAIALAALVGGIWYADKEDMI